MLSLNFCSKVPSVVLWPALLLLPEALLAQDFTGDGKPDILWRRRNAPEVGVWQMDGLAYGTAYTLQPRADSVWKIVGMADMGRPGGTNDGYNDILWENMATGEVAYWYMSNLNYLDAVLVQGATANYGWHVVGAGDFGSYVNGQVLTNLDAKTDIVLQHTPTLTKGLWIMNGSTFQIGVLLDDASPGWTLAAIGDFSLQTNQPPDGFKDLVYANYGTGQLAIQFMNGPNKLAYGFVNYLGNVFPIVEDKDYRVVGTGKFSTNTATRLDILFRHHTDGRQASWQMNGTNGVAGYEIWPHTWDTEYRMNTQELTDSTWRITRLTNRMLSASANSSPPQIILTFVDCPGYTFTIYRKEAGAPDYQQIASDVTGPYYTNNVQVGTAYDYYAYGYQSGSSDANLYARATVEAPPIHDRGRVLLIAETNLSTQIGVNLTNFMADLAGDGWTVIPKLDTPRHKDPETPWSIYNYNNATNLLNAMAIKTWIRSNYLNLANVKAVVILGHVAVPYSGTMASDGHTNDHAVPWAADLYYGDVVGQDWTTNSLYHFNEDYCPSIAELAVGRIDFARQPYFGTPDSQTLTAAETNLLSQYLEKSRRFRTCQWPYPLPNKAIYGDYILAENMSLLNAKGNSVAFFGNWPGQLIVGEPFKNNQTYKPVGYSSYLWAFVAGRDGAGGVYDPGPLHYNYTNIFHNGESPCAFWMLYGSYHADFNMSNNLPRCVLAKPNYGLVFIANSRTGLDTRYKLDSMALGETVGDEFLSSINETASKHRWLNIQGDPTLRLNSISPPTITSATTNGMVVYLSWSAGEAGSRYHVYRASSSLGPFELRTTGGSIPNTSYNEAHDANKPFYMVRGVKIAATGRGSYWNLSQGSTRKVQ